MSHSHSEDKGAQKSIIVPSAERDLATEQSIDALDYLRVQMRMAGLPQCADVLDEAFIACLRVYIAHKRSGLVTPEGAPAESDETVN